MRWSGTRGILMLLLFLFVGALLGGILADLLGSASFSGIMPYLVRQYTLLDFQNIHLNLLILEIDFGIRFAPNLLSVIGMMIAVSYHAIRGLTYARTQTGATRQLRYFHIGVLCYVAAEYILWTSGCFRQGDSASFLYYGFDVLLTGCVFALLPATGRAVQA